MRERERGVRDGESGEREGETWEREGENEYVIIILLLFSCP